MTRIVTFLTRKGIVAILGAATLMVLLWGVTSFVSASQPSRHLLSDPPPSVISYQGYITADGAAYTGSGYFKFAIVDEASGDGALNYWSNDGSSSGEPSSYITLTVSGGLFNVLLGGTSLVGMDYSIDHNVFSETDTYLRVWFSETGSGFQALDPNPRFSSVPYALRAQVADSGPDETDPVFLASPASAISTTNTTNWDTAYGWGDHATSGYLTSTSSVKQLMQDFVVAPGESVTAGEVVYFMDGTVHPGEISKFGSKYTFNSELSGYVSAAALTDTKFVVAYTNSSCTAVIGEVSGNTITYGSEYVFKPDGCAYLTVATLSDTKFVVAYSGGSGYGTAVIGDVSGTIITFGSEFIFNTDSSQFTSAAALTDSKFVVAYMDCDNSNYGTAVIGDVSAMTITYGSEFVFNSNTSNFISTAALSDTRFVVAYMDSGSPKNYGTAVIGDVSGTTITYGSEFVFNTDTSYYPSAAALTDSKFVVAYKDSGNSKYGTAVIGDVSAMTITYGSEFVFNTDTTDLISTAALSDTRFVVAFYDEGDSDYGIAVVGEVSGITITYGSDVVFNPADTYYISAAPLTGNKFVTAYSDRNRGRAVIGEAPTIVNIVGIAKESKTAGQALPVIIGGVSDVHSGLIPGEIYYRDISGSLTTTETDWPIGLAISETELLLDINIYGR